MGTDEAAARASPTYAPGRARDGVAAVAPVLAAVWCRSVAGALLADHVLGGLQLYPDSAAGPCTHSRYSIGSVCADVEVIALAYRVREGAATAGPHPVTLAAQWVAAGFSPAG